MANAINYSNEEILLALIWSMPSKLTKGQLGRLLRIKSAGQKYWTARLGKLSGRKLISTEKLDAGELFHGSPILRYYLSDANLEAIWRQYFVHYDERHHLVNDPFLTPFSSGIWNVTSSPEFSRLVGSKFNYNFICAKNTISPTKPSEKSKSLNKEKIWKTMDAVLSIAWKTEAYRRKPVLMETLNPTQKKAYAAVTALYDKQIQAHPGNYLKFTSLFVKNFKYYL